MKIVLFAAALVAVVGICQGELNDEQKAKLRVHNEKCMAESGVTKDDLMKLKAGDWSTTDPAMKKHSLCILQSIGFLDANGEFQQATFDAKLPQDANKEKVQAAVKECLAEPRPPTSEEFAWNLTKCFHQKNTNHELI